MFFRVSGDFGQTRHRAVGIRELAKHAARFQPGEPHEINRRLGVSRTFKHAAVARDEREHVSGSGEIRARRRVRSDDAHRLKPIRGGNAGRNIFRGVYGNGERRAVAAGVVAHHHGQFETPRRSRGNANADDSAAIANLHCDLLGGQRFRRENEVALVLAIFVVHDEHAFTGTQRDERIFHAFPRVPESFQKTEFRFHSLKKIEHSETREHRRCGRIALESLSSGLYRRLRNCTESTLAHKNAFGLAGFSARTPNHRR